MEITTKAFFDLAQIERQAQDKKWGEQQHSDEKWCNICMEELGEIAKAVIENQPDSRLLAEIVQLTALLQAWTTSKDWFQD